MKKKFSIFLGLIATTIVIILLYHFLQIYANNINFIIIEKIIIPILAFIITLGFLYCFNKNLDNYEKGAGNILNQKAKLQEGSDFDFEGEIDKRFDEAIKLLGSAKVSARTIAIYALYNIFIDDKKKKYRRQIAKILCSYIRSETQEYAYQKNNKDWPSDEIQICIDLLFKRKKKNNELIRKALYIDYKDDIDRADLSHSYLKGIDFSYANCRGVNFSYCNCQKASFNFTQCQASDFTLAKCQGSNFVNSKFQGAIFWGTDCKGAIFMGANFQGSSISKANFQGADFFSVKFQGAYFEKNDFQGAYALEVCNYNLKGRINKDTELQDVLFVGNFTEQDIKEAKEMKDFDHSLYTKLTNILQRNKNKEFSNRLEDGKLPEGIITGVLEDSKEIQKTIKDINKKTMN